MKKIIIVGAGVAALGLAVLPMAGVFAANSITDTITVTIDGSCSVGSASSASGTGKSFSDTVENGHDVEWAPDGQDAGALYVSCNDNSGWHITAVGGDGTGTAVTDMVKTGGGAGIPTSATFGGTTSAWGMQLAGTGVESGYLGDYAVVPNSAVKVAGGSGAVSEHVIHTGYKVWVSTTQASGTYTGKVTYTVAEGVN